MYFTIFGKQTVSQKLYIKEQIWDFVSLLKMQKSAEKFFKQLASKKHPTEKFYFGAY